MKKKIMLVMIISTKIIMIKIKIMIIMLLIKFPLFKLFEILFLFTSPLGRCAIKIKI